MSNAIIHIWWITCAAFIEDFSFKKNPNSLNNLPPWIPPARKPKRQNGGPRGHAPKPLKNPLDTFVIHFRFRRKTGYWDRHWLRLHSCTPSKEQYRIKAVRNQLGRIPSRIGKTARTGENPENPTRPHKIMPTHVAPHKLRLGGTDTHSTTDTDKWNGVRWIRHQWLADPHTVSRLSTRVLSFPCVFY